MIELNKKTQQDFLNREWVQRLLEVGVDMSDAKYGLIQDQYFHSDSVYYFNEGVKSECYIGGRIVTDILPTYTVSELLYKLHEWIYPTIDGAEYSGGLKMIKDAPFYIFWYELKAKVPKHEDPDKGMTIVTNEDYIYAEFEYPIESLASLLIQCHQKDIGMRMKDTGNISDK
jgi:hypothetical protein